MSRFHKKSIKVILSLYLFLVLIFNTREIVLLFEDRLAAKSDTNKLVTIAYVVDKSPAYGNLDVGDTLLKVNGKDISDAQQFQALIQSNAGKTINLQILRNGQEVSKSISLLERRMYPKIGILGAEVVETGLDTMEKESGTPRLLFLFIVNLIYLVALIGFIVNNKALVRPTQILFVASLFLSVFSLLVSKQSIYLFLFLETAFALFLSLLITQNSKE